MPFEAKDAGYRVAFTEPKFGSAIIKSLGGTRGIRFAGAAMRNLNKMLLILVCCTIVPASVQSRAGNLMLGGDFAVDYGQGQRYANPEPEEFHSTPPQPYLSTSPQSFVLITDRHDFHNSRWPTVVDAKPRVFIRSYNPVVGVYVDTEVIDPTCILNPP